MIKLEVIIVDGNLDIDNFQECLRILTESGNETYPFGAIISGKNGCCYRVYAGKITEEGNPSIIHGSFSEERLITSPYGEERIIKGLEDMADCLEYTCEKNPKSHIALIGSGFYRSLKIHLGIEEDKKGPIKTGEITLKPINPEY